MFASVNRRNNKAHKPGLHYSVDLPIQTCTETVPLKYGKFAPPNIRGYTDIFLQCRSLGSLELKIIGDEHSQNGADVADGGVVERRLVVVLCMPDIREWIADQVHNRYSCMRNHTHAHIRITELMCAGTAPANARFGDRRKSSKSFFKTTSDKHNIPFQKFYGVFLCRHVMILLSQTFSPPGMPIRRAICFASVNCCFLIRPRL